MELFNLNRFHFILFEQIAISTIDLEVIEQGISRFLIDAIEIDFILLDGLILRILPSEEV